MPLSKIDIKHFPDGETFCQVQETVRGKDVFVIQSGSPQPNEAYMELFVIMDALKRGSAARITAVIPYYGYARQDRKDQPRVPITAKLVANLLVAAGANRVLTMDLHAQQIQGFFDIPVDHLYAAPVMVKYLREMKLAKPLVVSPDTGGVKTAYAYSQMLGTGLAIVAKQRLGAAEVDAFSVVGDVDGCDVIMVDDMTTTCGTLCAAAKLLKSKGAKSVRAVVSHIPLTQVGIDRLRNNNGLIEELITTDSIPLADKEAGLPVHVLSVAPLLAEAITRIHNNQSVSSLFRLS
jgi:ribose-phosphate pyrophosphokinase